MFFDSSYSTSVSRYCQLGSLYKNSLQACPGLQLQAKLGLPRRGTCLVQGQRTSEVHCKLAEIREWDGKGALNLQQFFSLIVFVLSLVLLSIELPLVHSNVTETFFRPLGCHSLTQYSASGLKPSSPLQAGGGFYSYFCFQQRDRCECSTAPKTDLAFNPWRMTAYEVASRILRLLKTFQDF